MRKKILFGLLVFFLTILVGGLYTAPQFFIKEELNQQNYTFIASQFPALDDGGDAYFQFAREIYDGHFPPGDLFSLGGERLPNVYPWLPPLFLALLIWIFKDVSLAYLAANFVFSAISFLLFYILGLSIFHKNRLWSLFFGLVGILTPMSLLTDRLFFNIDDLLNSFKNFYPFVRTALPGLFMARVDYPLLTYPIYLLAIVLLIVFWRNPTKIRALGAGFSTGLLFYTYFHKWTYWFCVISFLFFFTLLFFRTDKKRVQNFIILIGTAALVSLPYFFNYFKLKNLIGSQDLIQRLSLEMGHSFNWLAWPQYFVYGISAIAVYFIFYKQDFSKAVLYWSFLAAAFFIWNVQLITGFVPHSDHWPRAINPLIFLIIFDSVYNLFKFPSINRPRLKFIISSILVIAITSLVAKKIINASVFVSSPPEILSKYVLPEDVLSSFRWIDNISREPGVISSSFVSSIYLAGFTSARPYLPWGGVTPMDNPELEDRFLTANKLFNVSDSVFESRLRDGQGLACGQNCSRPYIDYNISGARTALYQLYFKNEGSGNRNIPENKIKDLKDQYNDLKPNWKETESNWVYLGPWEKQFNSTLITDNGLSLFYQNSLVKIYKIK